MVVQCAGGHQTSPVQSSPQYQQYQIAERMTDVLSPASYTDQSPRSSHARVLVRNQAATTAHCVALYLYALNTQIHTSLYIHLSSSTNNNNKMFLDTKNHIERN